MDNHGSGTKHQVTELTDLNNNNNNNNKEEEKPNILRDWMEKTQILKNNSRNLLGKLYMEK